MATTINDSAGDTVDQDRASMSRSDRRTLDDLFRHPIAHNLAWKDVVGLFERVGSVAEKSNHEFVFDAGGQTQVMRRPHAKELTTSEVMDLRHFATRAGLSPHGASHAATHANSAAPALLVVVDHHGAKIYHIGVAPDDEARRTITPYDPHHFLHHLTHKDQSREQGQRAPEEARFYEQISQALGQGGQIVIIGHGTGHSNAAQHLTDYLAAHHRETYQRVVREVVADLSSVTEPQLLALAK
jgi:hypothetical protein